MFGARAATEAGRLADAAAQYRELFGRWPEPAELRAIDAALPRTDPWGVPFEFTATAGHLAVRSCGPDRAAGGGDDVAAIAPAAR